MKDTGNTPYLAIAVCCREWPVDPMSRMGRCGLCGEVPVIDWTLRLVVPDIELPDPWPDYNEGWIG